MNLDRKADESTGDGASTRGLQKTAFVLSGGGSCGAAQVGMLRELASFGVKPDFVVGTSVGALNGVWFAARADADGVAHMESVWRSLRRCDVFPISMSTLLRLVRRHDSLIDSTEMRALLEQHLPCRDLDASPIPVHVVATDLSNGAPISLCSGSAVDAILASMAIPAILPPVRLNGRLLVDGGLASNTPVGIAQELGATRIIVLPTAKSFSFERPPRSAIDFAMHAVSLLLARQLTDNMTTGPTQVVTVPVPGVQPSSPFEFSRTVEMIEAAAAQTRAWLHDGGLEEANIAHTRTQATFTTDSMQALAA